MMPRRKLTFQLTPLLDLLLIVLFLQYLDARATTTREVVKLETDRIQLSFDLDDALQQLTALREQLSTLEDQASRAETRAAETDRLRAQRDLLGEVVASAFKLPEATVTQLLQQRQRGGTGPTSEDVRQLQQRLQALTNGRGQELIDHLLTFGELRKRCDLWELYLDETGKLRLTVDERTFTFRAETADEFAGRLFESYKSLPEPKSMVLLLVTYGDTRFKTLKATLDGLPSGLERIRRDADGRTRFEFAILGFRPTPSAL